MHVNESQLDVLCVNLVVAGIPSAGEDQAQVVSDPVSVGKVVEGELLDVLRHGAGQGEVGLGAVPVEAEAPLAHDGNFAYGNGPLDS